MATAITGLQIQGNDLNIVVSRKVAENLFAGLATQTAKSKGGIGAVNDDYKGDAQLNTAKVFIYRFNRPSAAYRVLDGGANGNFINTNPAYLTDNSVYELPLTYVFDEKYDFPALQQGVLTYDLIEETAVNVGGIVTEFVDETTMDEMYASLKAYNVTSAKQFVSLANASGAAIDAADLKAKIVQIQYLQSNLTLDAGTTPDDNTSDRTVPVSNRTAVAKDTLINAIVADGLVIAGSDMAYSTLIEGIESETGKSFNEVKVVNNRYRGKYLGYSFFSVHEAFVPSVADGDFTAGELYAIFTHSVATTRAISQDLSRIVPGQDYLGERLQYLRRWGIKTYKPWMLFAMVSSDFTQ
jgi:hypothetical protein